MGDFISDTSDVSQKFRGLFFAWARGALGCNESRRYRMPMLEHLFELAADVTARYQSSEKTER